MYVCRVIFKRSGPPKPWLSYALRIQGYKYENMPLTGASPFPAHSLLMVSVLQLTNYQSVSARVNSRILFRCLLSLIVVSVDFSPSKHDPNILELNYFFPVWKFISHLPASALKNSSPLLFSPHFSGEQRRTSISLT